jgi:hypothetical protein
MVCCYLEYWVISHSKVVSLHVVTIFEVVKLKVRSWLVKFGAARGCFYGMLFGSAQYSCWSGSMHMYVDFLCVQLVYMCNLFCLVDYRFSEVSPVCNLFRLWPNIWNPLCF